MKYMKRIRGKITLFIVILLLMGDVQKIRAAGGSTSISVSSSSVNVGDTLNITLRVNADTYTSFQMNMAYSDKILEYTGSNKSGDCNGGEGKLSILSEVQGGHTYSISCTFKAIAKGETAIAVSTVEAIAMETGEVMEIIGSAVRIKVNNPAEENNQNNQNGGNQNNQNNQNGGNQNNQNNQNGGNQNNQNNQNGGNQNNQNNQNGGNQNEQNNQNGGNQNNQNNQNGGNQNEQNNQNGGNQNNQNNQNGGNQNEQNNQNGENQNNQNNQNGENQNDGNQNNQNNQNDTTQKDETEDGDNAGKQENTEENNTPTTEKLSKDNSLKKLTLSQGTLLPEFKYNVTKYKAIVGADVSSVTVDAQTSNSKATILSIVGNDELQMGDNLIQITVKSEAGTIAIYNITVTRGGEIKEETDEEIKEEIKEETKEEIKEEIKEESKEEVEEKVKEEIQEDTEDALLQESIVVINGVSYAVSRKLPEDNMPEAFVKTTTTYEEKEIEVYSLPYNELKLFYLKPMEAESETETENKSETENEQKKAENKGKYFIYDQAENQFFPYIYTAVGKNGVVILPMDSSETVPQGYKKANFQIGEFEISGCQSLIQEENATEIYLAYGVDKQGNAGWYQYDAVDMSLQRFQEKENVYIVQEESMQNDIAVFANRYQELESKYKDIKLKSQKTTTILICGLMIAILTIFNLLIFRKKEKKQAKAKKPNHKDTDIEYIDFNK